MREYHRRPPRGRTRELRRELRKLMRQGELDKRGTQTAVAYRYGVTRQHVSKLVREIRVGDAGIGPEFLEEVIP